MMDDDRATKMVVRYIQAGSLLMHRSKSGGVQRYINVTGTLTLEPDGQILTGVKIWKELFGRKSERIKYAVCLLRGRCD